MLHEFFNPAGLTHRGKNATQAISTISDTVTIVPIDMPVIHKVLGKSWNWGKDTDTIEYVPAKGEKALKEKLLGAEKIAFKR